MSSNDARTGAGQDDYPESRGSSTGQHITGAPEPGTFAEDEPPTAGTPADGSSNAGINQTGANRPGRSDS